MKIFVVNAGSSSLKYQLIDMENEQVLAKGLCERIGVSGAIKHKAANGKEYVAETAMPTHTEAFEAVVYALTKSDAKVIDSFDEVSAIGHRIVQGGAIFKGSCLITPKALQDIDDLGALAPLHNPANLMGIDGCTKVMPNVPQVAVFDTAFHQTMPDYASMYAIPYECYENYRVRRYGFHGTSHKFVARKACDILGLDINNSKIVTCHLGNGGSVTAVKDGKSMDTSMGFTPVEGVVMGTRCGNIDAGVITYLQNKENLNADGINALLNKKSGFLGVSGVSSDCRDVQMAAENGNARAELALGMFCHSVRKYIGAYSAVMGGIDAIVFTGGIGENDAPLRKEICSTLEYLGVEFDDSRNDGVRGEDKVLTKDGSKVKVVTLTTNEELVIAQDTMNLVNNK